MRYVVPFLLLMILMLFPGCLTSKPLTPSLVMSSCYQGRLAEQDTCSNEKKAMCRAFSQTAGMTYSDRAACKAQCSSVSSEFFLHMGAAACSSARQYGYTLCTRYCTQQYPE